MKYSKGLKTIDRYGIKPTKKNDQIIHTPFTLGVLRKILKVFEHLLKVKNINYDDLSLDYRIAGTQTALLYGFHSIILFNVSVT